MPNDAKLGLLTGVIGVIAVAVLSANRPAPVHPAKAPVPVASAPATSAPRDQPAAAVASAPALSNENTSGPIARTKNEPDGTPAGRTAKDDIDR
jgi:hypothetical protein